MKKILVPFDFSSYAESALNLAIQIGDLRGSEIEILHIIEYPMATTVNITGEVSFDHQMDQIYTLELIKKANDELTHIISKPEYAEKKLQFHVMMGNVYDGITSYAEKHLSDLIIMGTKGATGLKEMLVGSNAEKVVRTVKCPVLTTQVQVELDQINDIVFATDLDATASHVLENFIPFQELFEARIHLAFVETPNHLMETSIALEKLKNLTHQTGLMNCEVRVIKGFHTEEAIMNYAMDTGADMIALATHGYKGLLHLFNGSIAEDLVNHSPVPVWTMTQRKL